MNLMKTPVVTRRGINHQPSRDEKSELRFQLDNDINKISEIFEKEFIKLQAEKIF
jgi:hypothetical protein